MSEQDELVVNGEVDEVENYLDSVPEVTKEDEAGPLAGVAVQDEAVDDHVFKQVVKAELTNPTDHNYSFDDFEDIKVESTNAAAETRCEFLTGVAGSGKSYTVMQRIKEDPMYAKLGASTGIAAVNLDATTIHSLLGFFDTDSLRDAYIQGSAQRKLRQLVEQGYKNVVLDEISMISNDTLDLLVRVFDEVNMHLPTGHQPIGLICSGDFCQLMPIADKRHPKGRSGAVPWAFDAQCWPRFAENTTKLTKVWRQADEKFLAALNYARSGQGSLAAGALIGGGLKFENDVRIDFDGTTIKGRNEEVDRFNQLALDRVQGRLLALPSRRWGKQRSEWKNIPDRTVLRENAYVMLLSNKSDGFGGFDYVNGDCGHIKEIVPSPIKGMPASVAIELVRTGQVVQVSPLVRAVDYRDKPDSMTVEVTVPSHEDNGRYLPMPHYRKAARRYVEGQVEYYPMRLAYASTVHKSQGLSLDRVQIDIRDWTMRNPAMIYVALSRCRTIEGLRVVGSRERMAEYCKIDPRVKVWL